jgi:hypothetical protein
LYICENGGENARTVCTGRGRELSAPIGTQGVTLVEVVIVLACAGILLTAGVPNFNHLSRQWALWGAAHLLESSLQWGRSHAVSSNTSMALIVDSEGRFYLWEDGYTGERLEGTLRHLPAGVRMVSAPRRPLRFYQRGNAVPAGTFVLQGEVGSYRLIVSPGGRVRLLRD